ncbi:MAG: hypothetical protein EBQ80_05470 [Proteobacteria bacterium]|nr:hypothetical protein [Pseudomonadota bacterium]
MANIHNQLAALAMMAQAIASPTAAQTEIAGLAPVIACVGLTIKNNNLVYNAPGHPFHGKTPVVKGGIGLLNDILSAIEQTGSAEVTVEITPDGPEVTDLAQACNRGMV